MEWKDFDTNQSHTNLRILTVKTALNVRIGDFGTGFRIGVEEEEDGKTKMCLCTIAILEDSLGATRP